MLALYARNAVISVRRFAPFFAGNAMTLALDGLSGSEQLYCRTPPAANGALVAAKRARQARHHVSARERSVAFVRCTDHALVRVLSIFRAARRSVAVLSRRGLPLGTLEELQALSALAPFQGLHMSALHVVKWQGSNGQINHHVALKRVACVATRKLLSSPASA